jgi:hypothetical protein
MDEIDIFITGARDTGPVVSKISKLKELLALIRAGPANTLDLYGEVFGPKYSAIFPPALNYNTSPYASRSRYGTVQLIEDPAEAIERLWGFILSSYSEYFGAVLQSDIPDAIYLSLFESKKSMLEKEIKGWLLPYTRLVSSFGVAINRFNEWASADNAKKVGYLRYYMEKIHGKNQAKVDRLVDLLVLLIVMYYNEIIQVGTESQLVTYWDATLAERQQQKFSKGNGTGYINDRPTRVGDLFTKKFFTNAIQLRKIKGQTPKIPKKKEPVVVVQNPVDDEDDPETMKVYYNYTLRLYIAEIRNIVWTKFVNNITHRPANDSDDLIRKRIEVIRKSIVEVLAGAREIQGDMEIIRLGTKLEEYAIIMGIISI